MECVAFEYVVDCERDQYFLQIKAKLFTALSLITTTKRLLMLLDII